MTDLSFVWKYKILRISKTIMNNRTIGSTTFPDIRFFLGAIIIKTAWSGHKIRHVTQWKKIEAPDINSNTYGYLIFDKGTDWKNTLEKIQHLQQMRKVMLATCRKMQIDPYL